MTFAAGETHHADNKEALFRAISNASPGTRIQVTAPVIEIDQVLRITAPIILETAPGERALLRLMSPEAHLAIGSSATGGRIAGLDVASRGNRATPLLVLREADDFSLSDVRLGGSDGAAMTAHACKRLKLEDVSFSEFGLSAAELELCNDIRVDIHLAGIGRRARSAGLTLTGCSGAVEISGTDVSGNIMTVRSEPSAAYDTRLTVTINASQCHRALAVLGDADRPFQGLVADVVAEETEDAAVLLSNCHGIGMSLQTRGCAPLRLDGRSGARSCRIELASDQPDRVVQAGGSTGNAIARIAARRWPSMKAMPALSSKQRAFEPHIVEESCAVCGYHGLFRRTDGEIRETFTCPTCKASLRYRAQAQALVGAVAPGEHMPLREIAETGRLKSLSVFEPGQSGPLRSFLRQAGFYKSSVFGAGSRGGTELRDGMEFQDLTATTFDDQTFDLVVSSDIMEHVRKPEAAWVEIRRILKPGGHHVFSIPLTTSMPEKSVARVDTSGDADRLLLPAIYHGDGAGGRSLVYTDFGADLLDRLDDLGFPTKAVAYDTQDALCRSVLTLISCRPQ